MGRSAKVDRYDKYGDGDTPDLCPRCKKGVIADHEDRETCGKCGYSKITKRRKPGEPVQQNQGGEDQSPEADVKQEQGEDEQEEEESREEAEAEQDEAEDSESDEQEA